MKLNIDLPAKTPKALLGAFLATCALFTQQPTEAYSPTPGTPLATHSHPRLHITQQSIPALQQAIAAKYKNEYQAFVNWAWNTADSDKGNSISVTGHEIISPLVVNQAFVYAVGPVPGITYPVPLTKYANRAKSILLSQLQGGSKIAHAAALIYDWTYTAMSASERSQIANLMKTAIVEHKIFQETLQNPGFSKAEQMFDSKYYEGAYAWYIGLALWGDGLVDSAADAAVNTFAPRFLNNGYLDAQNFVAGQAGGWPEWVGYGAWHPRVHMLMIDGWRTATGEDFIANDTQYGNAIRTFGAWVNYAVDPHRYFGNETTFVRVGGAETTDTSLHKREMISQLYFLPRALVQSGLQTEAGLLHHFINHYQVPWANYEKWALWNFMGATQEGPAMNPDALGIPKSVYASNNGLFIARTGFSSSAEGVFYATDGHWDLTGGRGPGEHPGFGLVKFGELVNVRVVAHRGYGNLNDYPGGEKLNIIRYDGGHGSSHSSLVNQDQLGQAVAGQGNYDHGGLEQITVKDGKFYHVRTNRSRRFTSEVSHTREYVWLPGSNPSTDSDFLIVYDRSTAPTTPHWLYHVPWKPSGSNHSSTQDLALGSGLTGRIGTAYIGSNVIIKELNSIGDNQDGDNCVGDYVGGANAHGVAFAKTLLPTSARVEVTRVAEFDGDVCKRQHHLAIKSHRWQVDVIPTTPGTDHRFLHVFETADANLKSSMVPTSLIQAGADMQGAWVERQNSTRPNHAVLFHKNNGANSTAITYSLTGDGTVHHTITGVLPNTAYKVENITTGTTLNASLATESNVSRWDYKGVATNTETGTLFFISTHSGTQTYKVTPIGSGNGTGGDQSPPNAPSGFTVN